MSMETPRIAVTCPVGETSGLAEDDAFPAVASPEAGFSAVGLACPNSLMDQAGQLLAIGFIS
jgi:hypothetical protein